MIARATVKPGQEAPLQALLAEWKLAMRPEIPGSFLELSGNITGNPMEVVFIALAENQSAFEQLAATPGQQDFSTRFDVVHTAKPRWELVEMQVKSNG